ncbi:MAG TPA: NAD(P)/FAD-dependent oxidoreductase [bacterium]
MKQIVIIGAGIGGLTAGNLLAKKGHKVTIFEKHAAPGGYTAGFWRDGFYFESGTLSFESSAAVFKIMKEIGVFDKIRFIRQVTTIRTHAMDAVCRNFRDVKQAVYAAYPRDEKKLDKYFGDIDMMMGTLMAVMGPNSLLGYLAYPVNVARFLYLYFKYKNETVTDFTARYFDPGSDLNRFFNSLGYPDMSAAIVPAAYMSFFDDYWTVQNGMQSWADALADNFRQQNGELLVNSPVDKILIENNRAVGVIAKGRRYPADFVISSCDYKKTFLNLLDDPAALPPDYRDRIAGTAVSEGIFVVYLGLRLGNEELRRHMKSAHVHLHDASAGADIRDSDDLEYFSKTSLLLYSPSLHSARLAPEGKSSLMLQTMAPFHWLNNWGGGDKKQYEDLKQQAKKAMIKKAQKVIPDLPRYIEVEDAATPLTFERYTGNTDGATSAWSWNPKNKFYGDFISVNINTPFKNLLIGSCWSCQIGGVPSAITAAVKCAKKIG